MEVQNAPFHCPKVCLCSVHESVCRICRPGSSAGSKKFFAIAAMMVYTQNPAPKIWRKSKMKRFYLLLAVGFFLLAPARAQDSVIAPSDNLVVDGVPTIPASIVERARKHASYRSAILADWHPTKREMLVATRCADTPLLHLVKMQCEA